MELTDFYSFLFAKKANKESIAVAMDEEAKQKEEGFITLRRIFTIDKDMAESLGKEKNDDESGEANPAGNIVPGTEEYKGQAQDEAVFISGIAMDLAPRHSKTPIENCRAEDPRYCPYHGAAAMTQDLDNQFKAAGIYAHGGIERLGQGKFRLQYTVAPSKREQANKIIDGYLSKPGFNEVEDAELEVDEVDAVGKSFRTGKNNEYAMYHEYLDTLRKDMEAGMDIDRGDLARLEAEHATIGAMKQTAHEALKQAEEANLKLPKGQKLKESEVKKNCKPWQDYVGMWKKLEDDYNTIRGNADLSHVGSVEDAKEVADMMNSQLDQLGDFVKADQEVRKMKADKNLVGVKGIDGTTEFNQASHSLLSSIGSTISAAREKLDDAMKSGDLKRMRGALHKLEMGVDAAKERKAEIKGFMALADAYKKTIENTPAKPPKNALAKVEEQPKTEAQEPVTTTAPNAEPTEAEIAEAPETNSIATTETGTQEPIAPQDNHVESPVPPEVNEGIQPKQTSNSEESIEHNQTGNNDGELSDTDFLDVVSKYHKKHKIDSSKRNLNTDAKEFSNFLKKAQNGDFDNTPAGGGLYSNDNQFLNDIIDSIGEDHPYAKAFRKALADNGVNTQVENNNAEEKPIVEQQANVPANADEPSNQEETKKEESGNPYYDFLTTGFDDRAALYGDAGLSADIDYDNYVKKMDDKIDEALAKVNEYTGDDKEEFTKKTADQLKADLNAIAEEQAGGENAKPEENNEEHSDGRSDTDEPMPKESDAQPGSFAEEFNPSSEDIDKAAEIMSDDLQEITNMEEIKDVFNSNNRDKFGFYCTNISDAAFNEIKNTLGEDSPMVNAILAAKQERETLSPSDQPEPTTVKEDVEPPPTDLQQETDTSSTEKTETPTEASNEPSTEGSTTAEEQPPQEGGESQPENTENEPTGPVNTDENVSNFQNSLQEGLETFQQFFRDGRDIAIVTSEDDNDGSTAPKSIDSVKEIMKKSGIDGAVMAIPADLGEGPNAPKKMVYMVKMKKAK